MLKTVRALLLVLSIAAVGACSDLTGPDAAETEGYMGSDGQMAPTDAAPVLTEGYMGSDG